MRIDLPVGENDNPYGYAATKLAPEIMGKAAQFSQEVYAKSKLSLREFEGARIRTAEINGCMICQDFRAARDISQTYAGLTKSVADNGESPGEDFYQAAKKGHSSPLFSKRESLAIHFAEGFGEAPKELAHDEAFWAEMKANFTDAEIVDLAHSVAAWCGLGRVAHVLGLDEVCLSGPLTEAAE